MNYDALKGWGKEKTNEEKLLLRPAPHFLGLKFELINKQSLKFNGPL